MVKDDSFICCWLATVFVFLTAAGVTTTFVASFAPQAVVHHHVISQQRQYSQQQTQLFESLDFDYSSTWAWEQFYAAKNDVVEWHSSVSLNDIARLVKKELVTRSPSSSRRDDDDASDLQCDPSASTCLLVIGCGTSELPTVLRSVMPSLRLVLLDSSSTCINSLRARYHNDPYIDCRCEDATRLESMVDSSVDMILDKGFLDALLCSEGWNGLVERAMTAASRVLKRGTGKHIWIGYKLPLSTLTFIAKVAPELHWENDMPGSNENVSIRMAVKEMMISHV